MIQCSLLEWPWFCSLLEWSFPSSFHTCLHKTKNQLSQITGTFSHLPLLLWYDPSSLYLEPTIASLNFILVHCTTKEHVLLSLVENLQLPSFTEPPRICPTSHHFDIHPACIPLRWVGVVVSYQMSKGGGYAFETLPHLKGMYLFCTLRAQGQLLAQ